MKLLIIKPSSLGDVIHAQPFLNGLVELYPLAKISWLVNCEYVALLADNPKIEKVIPFERSIWQKGFIAGCSYFFNFIIELRKEKFDLVIDLQGLFRSGLISFLTGAKKRIGLNDSREGSYIFYTQHLGTKQKNIHAVDKLLALLKELKWQQRTISLADFTLYIPELIDFKVKEMLKIIEGKKIVVINPVTRWKTKLWPAQKYITLINNILDRDDYAVVLIGTNADAYITEKISAAVNPKMLNLAGKTNLLELASLLKQSDLLISSDSGPVHIANAVGCKTITLFGPTSPKRTGAYLPGDTIVNKNKSCSPCFAKECKEISCMQEIEPEDILKHL